MGTESSDVRPFGTAPRRPQWLLALLLAWLLQLAACGSLPTEGTRDEAPPLPTRSGGVLDRLIAGQRPPADAPAGASAYHLIDDGLDALAVRLALIRRAQRSLDLQTYIWADDTSGRLMMRELLRAADRGVRVRLLLDDNNTAGLDPLLRLLDAHPAITVRLFNPFPTRVLRLADWVGDFRRVNRRMHNKLMLADGQLALIGGRNLGDAYFRASDDVRFEDTELLVHGPVVGPARASFERYWHSLSAQGLAGLLAPTAEPRDRFEAALSRALADPTTRQWRTDLRDSPVARALGSPAAPWSWAPMELIDDPPLKVAQDPAETRGSLLPHLEALFGTARHSLDLVSAYFVPGDEGASGLAALARRGVQVRVLTNSLAATDVAAAHVGYARHRASLAAAGVTLLELQPHAAPGKPARRPQLTASRASLHAKTFVVDGHTVFIGSMNLDPRSTRLNTEVGLVVHSPALAARLRERLDLLAREGAWQVRAIPGGGLRWDGAAPADVAVDTEVDTRAATDPDASLGRRLLVWLLSWFDWDWLL